ncbi:flagellar hook-associated protein FlgK [Bacillus sp. FJAT-45350]|uniref:flagellar hook-associated protein FlgK n=1 Tax=Bacillus sp. FJAT-45350 TaxID=2011014 RepID=UPI0027BA97E3|nr:flagellar hook-associated protein FlgK [Bacillus sp. FJAT-45350]
MIQKHNGETEDIQMQSTFHGLETARRGMMAQQAALHTTGHNIANANTEGYSRQRVNFNQTEPYPAAAMNRPRIPGHLGTGVEAGSIQRMRDQFLDVQYRNENQKFGYWDARFEALQKMEDVMNEPSEQGLANTIDRFWQSLQDLAVQPEDAGARAVVRQRGIAVAETFRYAHDSLSAIRKDYETEVSQTERDINSLIRQINNVNRQIGDSEPHGYVTNDLYDERDRLVDQLSQYLNIKTDFVKSSGNPNPVAEGKMTIWLADSAGNAIENAVLINGADYEAVQGLKLSFTGEGTNKLMSSIQLGQLDKDNYITETAGISWSSLDQFPSSGKLKGMMEAYGYQASDGTAKGIYPEMLSNLDEMAYVFATEFNKLHEKGWNLVDIKNGKEDDSGTSFFRDLGNVNHDQSGKLIFSENQSDKVGFAARIGVSLDIHNSTDYIAVASNKNGEAFAGDGSNALLMANMKDTIFSIKGSNANIQSFYRSVIGDMAVDTSEALRLKGNSDILRGSVQFRRDSVSNVSLDEEMTNMIKYQHAYNAAARGITLVDEMLDRIINGMGLVGR